MCQISWANHNVSATGDNRNQKSNPGRLGVVLQVQTEVDIKIVPPAKQASSIPYGDCSDAEVRFWHMDPVKKTRENDEIDSTQHASTHCPNEQKVQEEDTGHKEGKGMKKTGKREG